MWIFICGSAGGDEVSAHVNKQPEREKNGTGSTGSKHTLAPIETLSVSKKNVLLKSSSPRGQASNLQQINANKTGPLRGGVFSIQTPAVLSNFHAIKQKK